MTDPTSPAPSTSSVSAADRRRLRASHQMREHPTPTLKPGVWQLCRQDKREWPCMTIRLLDALEAAERALAASRAETAALRAENAEWREARNHVSGDYSALRRVVGALIDRIETAELDADWYDVVEPVRIQMGNPTIPARSAAPTPGADGGTT